MLDTYYCDKLILEVNQFLLGITQPNTLFRLYKAIGTTNLVDAIKWDKRGIEVWRQEEGCLHNRTVLGPYALSWEQLEKSSKANEDISLPELLPELYIPKESLGKLLKLKGREYKNAKDAKELEDILGLRLPKGFAFSEED